LYSRCSSSSGIAWQPVNRERAISPALQSYAAMTTSSDTGALRDVSQLRK
jgi:dihydroxy-acid dehydratase